MAEINVQPKNTDKEALLSGIVQMLAVGVYPKAAEPKKVSGQGKAKGATKCRTS
jgi:hypothetical protein